MKITVINGCHRIGNTYRIVNEMCEQLQQHQQIKIDHILLKNENIEVCKGCFQCFKKGPENCPIKDGVVKIVEKINSSDGVVFASPVFNFGITSKMKNFIDRLAYIGHRPQFFGKDFLIIATAGGIGTKDVIQYLEKYVGEYWGFSTYISLGVITPPYKQSEKEKNVEKKRIKNVARKYFKNLVRKKTIITLSHLMQFTTLRVLFTNSKMAEGLPLDYRYYSTLKGKKYYNAGKVNIVKYGIALLFAKIVGLFAL